LADDLAPNLPQFPIAIIVGLKDLPTHLICQSTSS
jgi:hypothetical protein